MEAATTPPTDLERIARWDMMFERYQSPINSIHVKWTEDHMGCDGDLLIAIMVADSSLGTRLLTPYNPGNSGNTDSGHRRSFEGWQQGVDAICETLNNKYLGGLTMLGELSGGGRAALGLPGCAGNKCYATSTSNWHRNVTAIMSELKGETIGADYVFRRQ